MFLNGLIRNWRKGSAICGRKNDAWHDNRAFRPNPGRDVGSEFDAICRGDGCAPADRQGRVAEFSAGAGACVRFLFEAGEKID